MLLSQKKRYRLGPVCCFMRATHAINSIYKLFFFKLIFWINLNIGHMKINTNAMWILSLLRTIIYMHGMHAKDIRFILDVLTADRLSLFNIV